MSFETQESDYEYLIKNENDKSFGIVVNSIGFQTVQPQSFYPDKRHPAGYYFNIYTGRKLKEYQLVYITKGSGEISLCCGQKTKVEAGDIFVLQPDMWHSYHPSNSIGWNEYYIGFEGKLIESIFKNKFLSEDNCIIKFGLNEELVTLYKRALEVVKLDRKGMQQHLAGIVLHMLGLILYEISNRHNLQPEQHQIVENAKIIMNENVMNKISPEEIAGRLGVKYTSFRKNFKKVTGYAPAQYFHELKIKKAKQLLHETAFSVKEISYMLNYYSVENFVTLFKKHTGYSPTKYRQFSK
ncbi:MAG: AraC family transcriptional regulator [Paludibacter sp.]|nr:AraC family transcriptional regulator [Paludibacter sp.]